MSGESGPDPIDQALRRLVVGDVDPERAEGIRTLCATALGQGRRTAEARRERAVHWRRRLELAAAAGLALLYLAGTAERVLQILS